jgi:cysteinyl-tRNA synthetase
MSSTHLGATFDVHTGGKDLVFPHHENEVAQSEAASGEPYVRYWLHNGFVNVDAEKMSKSLGNFFTIRDITRIYHPQAIRWFLLGTHYRQEINYTERNLEEASDRAWYIHQTLHDLDLAVASGEPRDDGPVLEEAMVSSLLDRFHEAMDDDFNTAAGIAVLAEPLKVVNDLLHTKQGRKARGRLRTMAAIREGLGPVLEVLAIGTRPPADVLGEMRAVHLARMGLDEAEVAARIAERIAARQAKDWARADAIRDELLARRVQLMDSPSGTTWRPIYEVGGAEEPAAGAEAAAT